MSQRQVTHFLHALGAVVDASRWSPQDPLGTIEQQRVTYQSLLPSVVEYLVMTSHGQIWMYEADVVAVHSLEQRAVLYLNVFPPAPAVESEEET